MTLTKALKDQCKNTNFKKEYEALEPEYALIRALIDARNSCNITQKELAAATGIAQSDISKIENGNANPSLKTLKKLVAAFGKKLVISFE